MLRRTAWRATRAGQVTLLASTPSMDGGYGRVAEDAAVAAALRRSAPLPPIEASRAAVRAAIVLVCRCGAFANAARLQGELAVASRLLSVVSASAGVVSRGIALANKVRAGALSRASELGACGERARRMLQVRPRPPMDPRAMAAAASGAACGAGRKRAITHVRAVLSCSKTACCHRCSGSVWPARGLNCGLHWAPRTRCVKKASVL